MNLPADVQRLLPVIAVVVIALGAAVLVTRGLGGQSTGSANQMLDRALQQEPQSAAVTMRVTFAVQDTTTGKRTTAAEWTASGELTEGPQGTLSNGRIHLIERTAGRPTVTLDEVAAGEAGFIAVDGRWYRVSPAQYQRIFAAGSKTSLIQALEFDPRKWIRDAKLDGTAEIDGVEVNHLRGEIDADAMLTDLGFYRQDPGESASARELTQFVRRAKKQGTADVYAGKHDGVLRRLSVATRIEPAAGGGPLRATLTFAVGFANVDEPVKVTAPANALPPARIAEIPRSKLGAEADDILGPAPRQTSPPRTRPHPARPPARAKPKRRARPSTNRYVNCVRAAETLPALQRCQPLLP